MFSCYCYSFKTIFLFFVGHFVRKKGDIFFSESSKWTFLSFMCPTFKCLFIYLFIYSNISFLSIDFHQFFPLWQFFSLLNPFAPYFLIQLTHLSNLFIFHFFKFIFFFWLPRQQWRHIDNHWQWHNDNDTTMTITGKKKIVIFFFFFCTWTDQKIKRYHQYHTISLVPGFYTVPWCRAVDNWTAVFWYPGVAPLVTLGRVPLDLTCSETGS